jgi:glycerophosphoryl diester phosphodiesterase
VKSSVALLLLLLSSCSCDRPDVTAFGVRKDAVIAHRGLSGLLPEHTLASHRAARELGVDYLEVDVQRTRDDVLVVFHDETLERTTNVAEVFPERAADPVGSFTFEELQRLDAGSWFANENPHLARTRFSEQRIVTLKDIVDVARTGPQQPGLYVETKDPSLYPGIEEQILAELNGIESVAQSFDADSLSRFRDLDPDVPRLLLIGGDEIKASGMEALIQTAVDLDAGIGPVGYSAWPWDVSAMHAAGRFVHPWTINEGWQLSLITSFGADGLFSDRADRAMTHYGRETPDVEKVLESVAGILAL